MPPVVTLLSKVPLNNNKNCPLRMDYIRPLLLFQRQVYVAAALSGKDQQNVRQPVCLTHVQQTLDVGKQRNCGALNWIERISTLLCNL